MPRYPVLPHIIEDETSWKFLTEDLSQIFARLSEDPSLWGVELLFFRDGNTCIPTNRQSWLDIKHGLPSIIPTTKLSPIQMMALLEISGGTEVVQSTVKNLPEARFSGSDRCWVCVVIARGALLLSVNNLKSALRDDIVSDTFSGLSRTPAAEMAGDLPKLYRQALTCLCPPRPEGAHARLSWAQDKSDLLRQFLKRRSIMMPSTSQFCLREDWISALDRPDDTP